jgi:hypothetical protein
MNPWHWKPEVQAPHPRLNGANRFTMRDQKNGAAELGPVLTG